MKSYTNSSNFCIKIKKWYNYFILSLILMLPISKGTSYRDIF